MVTDGPVDNAQEAARLCEEGYELLEARDFGGAQVRLARARRLDPGNPLIHYRSGLLFSDMGRPEDAVSCFDATLAIDGNEFRAHNNRGSALQALGRMAEAEAAFRRAIEIAPDLELPYVNLGHLLDLTGRSYEAASVYREALSRRLNAPLFEHYLAALAGATTERAPDEWVVATFDNFAPRFDAHLGALRYVVPERIASLLSGRDLGQGRVLDLGCGTGLCGAALAGLGTSIVGVDLSPRMAAQAEARGVYANVSVSEIHAWLAVCGSSSFDAVIAADLLIYIGALERLFDEVARVLRPDGWFAFSTEECGGDRFRLMPTGRYAQAETYIATLANAHFGIVSSDAAIIRREMGAPVAGRVWLLRRNGRDLP